ncbi:DUF1700 domain-containing protein [Lawsonibacter faecis]|uniref:DUF1700 domain-containing protein n=1 Tax=Lawsonibacter faecis TaxID=2763052 RepID=A0A8J6MDV3_9FIRM|nr:DUF1700 domain-containing protein [Lawsonibacter faecis]MBC5738259.1 DUF1700 domain-containing protein [Lawsonibacter faecis]
MMNREEYLQELYARLSNRLPRQELDNVMKYYEEYFDEAGSAREQEIIAELGTPAELAAEIAGRKPTETQYVYEPRPRRRRSAGQIVLLACLSPIWVPLLIAAVAVVFSLIVALFAVAGSIAAAGLGCVLAGIFSIWCGFTAIFSGGIPTLMFFGGAGLFIAALGLLLFLGGVALCGLCGKGTAAFCRMIFGGGNKREVMA